MFKFKWFLFCFVFAPFIAFAQQVKNVHFEQVGKEIHIYYDLVGDGDYWVDVYCSEDGGANWGKLLEYVTGDVGNDQKSGVNKMIVWDVLKEREGLASSVQFKVVASCYSNNNHDSVGKFVGNSGIVIDDRDGKKYNWVKIGDQYWMTENMNIGVMVDITTKQTNNNTIEKYCFDDNPQFCNKYGGLYRLDEAFNYKKVNNQGVCPTGWHVSTEQDWNILLLETDRLMRRMDYFLSSDQKNKSKKLEHYYGYALMQVDEMVINKSSTAYRGLTKLDMTLGGRVNTGLKNRFVEVSEWGFYWISPMKSENEGNIKRFYRGDGDVLGGSLPGREACSVRCVKD